MRTTKEQVNLAFERMIKQMGGRIATSYNDVGAFRLDSNPTYGGYVVEQIISEGGAVTRPFGDKRMKPNQAWETFWFASRTLEVLDTLQKRD